MNSPGNEFSQMNFPDTFPETLTRGLLPLLPGCAGRPGSSAPALQSLEEKEILSVH